MIKVSISRNNQVTNQGTFASQLEADAWLAQEEANKSFGKPAGFYPISQLSPEELAQEISRKEVDELGNPIEVMVEIPAQYSVAISDISLEVEQQRVNQEALAYLASTDWLVIRANEDLTKPIPEDVKVKRQEARNKIVK